MKKFRLIPLIVFLILAGWAITQTVHQPTAQAQGENLLANPSFEGAYSSYIPQSEEQKKACPVGTCTTAQMPAGWFPWWVVQTANDEPWQNRMPEYKPVCPYAPCPYPERLKDGAQALQYFTFHSTHTAGVWQRLNVPNNANLKLSVWGMAWSSASDATYSDFPTPVNMRVGIDPTGGTNPFSPAIVWSGYANPYDQYVPFEVQATAQGGTVTVFFWSKPQEARKHNDIYWDGASLVVTGQGAPAPAPSTSGGGGGAAAPAPVFRVGPTPTPNAEGVIQVEVQPGDALWSIAARAGITLDEILEYNGISRSDFIKAGDILIIGYAEASSPAAASAESAAPAEGSTGAAGDGAETAEAEAEPEATVAPVPTPEPTATPAPSTGEICLLAFDDANSDGFFTSDEALKTDVAITIANGQAVVSNYITTGSEPFCIEGLDPGSYRVSRSLAAGEVATNAADWGVTLAPGMSVQLDFGSQMDAVPPAEEVAAVSASSAETAATTAESAPAQSSSNLLNWLVGIIVGVAVLLLLGVGFIVLSARRTQ